MLQLKIQLAAFCSAAQKQADKETDPQLKARLLARRDALHDALMLAEHRPHPPHGLQFTLSCEYADSDQALSVGNTYLAMALYEDQALILNNLGELRWYPLEQFFLYFLDPRSLSCEPG